MPGQARPGRVGRRDGKVMDGFPRVVDMSSGAGRVPSVMGWVGAHEWCGTSDRLMVRYAYA